MTGTGDPVLVVGGGIAGLTTAIGLKRAGVPVTVLERAPRLQAMGGAIQIWANGMHALRQLGCADRIRSSGSDVETQLFLSAKGDELARLEVGDIARRHGSDPPVMIPRADLLEILADEAGADIIRTGAKCVGFEQDEDAVMVRLETGDEVLGSALVGADGIDSTVRAKLQPESSPWFAGYQYLRAMIPYDDFPKGRFTFVFGKGDRFGLHDVSDARLYWFGVLLNEPGAGDPPEGRKTELARRFADFTEPIPEVIAATPEESIMRSDIRDLTPLEQWTDGRVTLIGDAAHATTPNLGRGAGEAVEDAVALAQHISGSPKDTPGALRAYEEERREAAAEVQRRSRRLGRVASRTNPAFIRLRKLIFTRFVGPGMVRGAEREFAEYAASRSG